MRTLATAVVMATVLAVPATTKTFAEIFKRNANVRPIIKHIWWIKSPNTYLQISSHLYLIARYNHSLTQMKNAGPDGGNGIARTMRCDPVLRNPLKG